MSRTIAVLMLSVIASGCDMLAVSGPRYTRLYAVISAAGPFDWDCNDVGCRFQAQGMNEGPACATGVEGLVRFVTKDGFPVLDRFGSVGGATYLWRVHPHPGVPLTPGLPFELASTELVPQDIVAQTRSYQAVMTQGGVIDAC